MTYSYFPGCTLKNKAKDLDHYARECAKVLGFELEEIENWQCCGAVYPQASDEIATKLSSVRALADGKDTFFQTHEGYWVTGDPELVEFMTE